MARNRLLLLLSLLLQVAVGYLKHLRCVEYRRFQALRARTSKKKEVSDSGGVDGNNELNGDYNDLNFTTQLQQLISGTNIDKVQSNKGPNSQSDVGK